MIQEAARAWLHCPSNSSASGFRTVAELYLLHVLLPLGHSEAAREFIVGEAGIGAFTEHQRQTVLEVLEAKEQQNREPDPNPDSTPDSEIPACPVSSQGHTFQFSF